MALIDFKAIAAGDCGYNFHTHTPYCDGRAPMEDFVKRALELGYTQLGFSPHSPIPFESSCNMSQADVTSYFDEIQRLRTMCGDRLKIYAGMEVDYVDDWGPAHPYFASLPLDYTIGSVHFIPSPDNPATRVDVDGNFENFKKKMSTFFHDDIEWVVTTFFTQMLKMVEAGGFDIVGHFDKILRNASQFREGIDGEAWYKQLVEQLIHAIIARGPVVEINTKAWEREHRFFPHRQWWPALCDARVTLIVNSDAHEPALLHSGRDAAISMLDTLRQEMKILNKC